MGANTPDYTKMTKEELDAFLRSQAFQDKKSLESLLLDVEWELYSRENPVE